MKEGTEILDEDFEKNLSVLSAFQLVGILTEKVRYPKIIYQEVRLELDKRNINEEEFNTLKKKYLSPAVVDLKDLDFHLWPSLSFLLIFTLFSGSFVKVSFSLIVIIGSLWVLRRRFRVKQTPPGQSHRSY